MDKRLKTDERRVYQKDWVAKRRQEYVEQRGGGCERCGCTVDLEFHHRLPEIKVTHRIFSYSRKKIEAELIHCDLLCRKPCHSNAQKEANVATNILNNFETEYNCKINEMAKMLSGYDDTTWSKLKRNRKLTYIRSAMVLESSWESFMSRMKEFRRQNESNR